MKTTSVLPEAAAPGPVQLRSVGHGLGRSWRDYRSLLHWHLASLRIWLALLVAVQALSGVGFVLGISLFFKHVPASAAVFVSTGVPVINLLLVGLILGPQLVADQKVRGGYEYLRVLPVSRPVDALAWYTVCLAGGVPAMVVSLGAGVLRYNLDLRISPAVIPAVALTSFTATMFGYALAHAISQPMATRLVTQLLVFLVFGFAPILFPITQMPRWLGTLNWWFPFRHMADVMRAALVPGPHPVLATSYIVLGVWSVACAALAGRALARRR